jgi:MFS family permease
MNKVYPSRLEPNFAVDLPPLGAVDIDLAPDNLVLGVLIGQFSRCFDLFVYAIGSALIFPKLFFPMSDRLSGVVYAFAIFGLAFVARPFGTALFAGVEHRHGRAIKLISAALLSCGAMAAVSLLPGYDRIGPAAIGLLALFRVGQGLAAGGVGDGSASLRALGGPAPRRGFAAMSAPLGVLLSFLLATGLFGYSASGVSAAEFIAWGWRFPFLVAVAVNMVALFARLRLMTAERLGRSMGGAATHGSRRWPSV